MAAELGDFSQLVKAQLHEYNKEINTNVAVLTDDACSDCQWVCGLFVDLIGCTAWDYLIAALVCTMTGPLLVVCVILVSVAIAAICYFGVPPYCLNLCQFAGYCAPLPQYNWVSGVVLPPITWEDGFVSNPDGLVGIANDESFVLIYGGNYGDGGAVIGVMSGDSTGHILLYGYSDTGYYTHLYVFVSYNNYYDWYQPTIGVQTVDYADGQHWIDCGTYSGTFRFIAIVAIDDNGMSAKLFVDSVMVH